VLLRWGADLNARTNGRRGAYHEASELPIDMATRRGHHNVADAIRAEEIRRRDHGFKRDPSTIPGTEEYEASRRPRVVEVEGEVDDVDLSDDDDDDDDDDDES